MTTNDKIIRTSLRIVLKKELEQYKTEKKLPAEIFEEFGVSHGAARIDFAVINGVLHGYEIKSDKDTLERLPEQMKEYNAVFDKVTLVVGKRHLYHGINTIPDWWGIMIAKIDKNKNVGFYEIRKAGKNVAEKRPAMTKLLWKEEALQILEGLGEAGGVRSKTRNQIYNRLAAVLDQNSLGEKVREKLFFREDWRSDAPLVLNGG